MSPPKLTPQERKLAQKKVKAYQKEYQKKIPIELRRIYEIKRRTKQTLKTEQKTI